MGSKVVVTYKRKRLFSRSDHSHLNLHSDMSCKSAKPKTTDKLPKQEGPITECTLQNNDTRIETCAYSKDDVRKGVLQCENCDSHCCSQCSEKQARKLEMLYSACAEQKDSSVSIETEKFTPEQRCSPKADTEHICHPNVLLNGCPEVRYKIDSSARFCAMSSGSEYEDNCKKIFTVSQPPDACSGGEPDPMCLKTSAGINSSCQTKGIYTPEASTLEEKHKLYTDQYSSLSNNSSIKRKLTSALITFCRRSKRNRADIAVNSATLPAASCLVDPKNEKELPKNNENSCSFSAPDPATSTVVLADNPQHFPRGEAADSPNAAAHHYQDSDEQMPQQKVCTDVQDNHNINVTAQRLSDEDVKSRRMHGDVSGRGDVLPLDLSVPPHASHNIDCNLPLDGGSDDIQPVQKSEVLHDSLGSTSKIKEDMPSFPMQCIENGSPVRAVSDKGKCIMDSPLVLTCNSSKNNYIQFFPESRSDGMLQLSNNSEKVSRLDPSSLQSSNLIGLSFQPEQMVDGRACFPPLYEWPNVQVQSRGSFRNLHPSTSDRTQLFARDKMMLDNILTRARAVRGNKSTFLDKFEYPTTWLDEELDSLWIGVRRHGRGNWDAILGDRRLHFLPWKTSWDLAERWQVEQSRLLCSMPVSQRRYASPPDFSSEHLSNLHHSQPEAQVDEVCLSLGRSHPVQKGLLPLHLMNNKTKRELSEGSGFIGDDSSTAGLRKGSLPHWLRTAAEIPPGPARQAHVGPSGCHSGLTWLNQPSHQPWVGNQYISTQRRPELENGGKAPCSSPPLVVERGKTRADEHVVSKQEDLIIIPSDASSEETISDDHSIRP